jgi:hypothetical protein
MFDEDREFEDEVRRLARHLWPEAQYSGAAMIGERERDGVFETEECVHLIEATTSTRKAKVQSDSKKLVELARSLQRKPDAKPVKCWLVTKHEPTADQRSAAGAAGGHIHVLSIAQLEARLIDAATYLSARTNYPFGSVRDPSSGHPDPKTGYVPLTVLEPESAELWDIAAMSDELANGGRIVLLGDFGAGKSMTAREVFRRLRTEFLSRRLNRFPIYLNLRDHHGQRNPAEVLERHARNVGFPNPSHLVRAWRAGQAILMLDGFDELTALGFVGVWKKLQEARFRSMEAVRSFARDTPPSAGVMLVGRAHFFDGDAERRRALGTDSRWTELTLNDFSDEQVLQYLKKAGYAASLPAWLPLRPLLVGYLIANNLLAPQDSNTEAGGALDDPAKGWDLLLSRLGDREALIEAGIDGATVRRIMERIATFARSFHGGLGPISSENIVAAFDSVCGDAPDAVALTLLQRLPGLGIPEARMSGDSEQFDQPIRQFINEEFADACRAGDLARYIDDPFGFGAELFSECEIVVGSLAVSMVSERIRGRADAAGKVRAAYRTGVKSPASSPLLADLVRVVNEIGGTVDVDINIRDVLINELDLGSDTADLSRVEFADCYFGYLSIESDATERFLPHLSNCMITELEGRTSQSDLPSGVFSHCEIEEFATSAQTTTAILNLDLAVGTRVLLSVLRKLYMRRGGGRKENALFRGGLDSRERRLVPDILQLLLGEKLAIRIRRGEERIWLPVRSESARVLKLLSAPTGQDPLLRRAAALN